MATPFFLCIYAFALALPQSATPPLDNQEQYVREASGRIDDSGVASNLIVVVDDAATSVATRDRQAIGETDAVGFNDGAFDAEASLAAFKNTACTSYGAEFSQVAEFGAIQGRFLDSISAFSPDYASGVCIGSVGRQFQFPSTITFTERGFQKAFPFEVGSQYQTQFGQ